MLPHGGNLNFVADVSTPVIPIIATPNYAVTMLTVAFF